MSSILENGVVVGAQSKGRFAIGRGVRVIGAEHYAMRMRAQLTRTGPPNFIRFGIVAISAAVLIGTVAACLFASF